MPQAPLHEKLQFFDCILKKVEFLWLFDMFVVFQCIQLLFVLSYSKFMLSIRFKAKPLRFSTDCKCMQDGELYSLNNPAKCGLLLTIPELLQQFSSLKYCLASEECVARLEFFH